MEIQGGHAEDQRHDQIGSKDTQAVSEKGQRNHQISGIGGQKECGYAT